jgi:Cupin-like domain
MQAAHDNPPAEGEAAHENPAANTDVEAAHENHTDVVAAHENSPPYTDVAIQIFNLDTNPTFGIWIPDKKRTVRCPLVTVNALANNNLSNRIQTLHALLTPARLATNLLDLDNDTLCKHLQMVIVAFLKKSNLFPAQLNDSIALCISLMFGRVFTLEADHRIPLGYASRTSDTVMTYFNSQFHPLLFRLTQAIPENIQQMILNNQAPPPAAIDNNQAPPLAAIENNHPTAAIDNNQASPLAAIENHLQGNVEAIENAVPVITATVEVVNPENVTAAPGNTGAVAVNDELCGFDILGDIKRKVEDVLKICQIRSFDPFRFEKVAMYGFVLFVMSLLSIKIAFIDSYSRETAEEAIKNNEVIVFRSVLEPASQKKLEDRKFVRESLDSDKSDYTCKQVGVVGSCLQLTSGKGVTTTKKLSDLFGKLKRALYLLSLTGESEMVRRGTEIPLGILLMNDNNLNEIMKIVTEKEDTFQGNCQIFLSNEKCRTNTHFDDNGIVYTCIAGKRIFYIARPDAIFLHEKLKELSNNSVIDPLSLSEGHLVRDIFTRIELNPGDTLVLRPRYWHQVESIVDDELEVSAGFNTTFFNQREIEEWNTKKGAAQKTFLSIASEIGRPTLSFPVAKKQKLR